MPVQFESPHDVPVSSLVGEIVQDSRQLIIDQLTLFRVELKKDMRRAVDAAVPVCAGALALMVSIFLLGIGGAYLLSWLVPELPLWGSYFVVGGVIGIAGGILVAIGVVLLRNIKPAATALKGLEENVQWKTKN
ncbi:MAG TPA: phage holin family protein [Gemmataceae bacterium]|nr:phage holin family protein [Gemmataceae bacterium]